MSSTSNVQNLLSNVFRPTFVYNTLSNYYQTKLELVNIDTVSANTITTYAVNVRDSNSNAYIGSGAGNPNSSLATSLNSNNTFVGTNAGASSQNVSSGVLIGYLAGSPGSGVGSISIGASTTNGGNSNIYIGYGSGVSAGNNNIFIGPGITPASNTSNTLLIGTGATPTIIGDLTGRRIGINKSSLPVTSPVPLALDVEGYARIQTGGLGINKMPGSFNLDVNGSMQVSDGFGVLTFSNSTTTISNTASYPNCNATLQVTGGFFSTSGSVVIANGVSSNIGILKKGIVIVSAQDPDTLSNVSASKIFMTTISNGTYVASDVASSTNLAAITNSTSNIALSNSDSNSHTFAYSITYFPTP